jgi:hypothetical protein
MSTMGDLDPTHDLLNRPACQGRRDGVRAPRPLTA